MSAVPSPRTIVLGNPPSPHHQPDPLLLVQWMEYLETTAGLGGTAYFEATLSDLQAVSSPDEGAVGFVLDDGSDSGVYRYDGSSWSKTADLPKGFAAERFDLASRLQPYRPGDAPESFSDARTGDPGAGGAAPGSVVTVSGEGATRQITGAAIIALRDRIHIEDVGEVTFVWRYIRAADPTDPNGDAIRTGVAWLDADKDLVNLEFETEAPFEADGEQERTLTLKPEDAPSGAVYVTPWIQTFGSDGVVEVRRLGVDTQKVASASIITKREHRTLHVSPDGASGNNGENRTLAVPTLEDARDLMVASEEPTAVMFHPGVYESSGHIDMPDNLTGIIGQGHPRSTIIRPSEGNEVKNVLRLGNGGYVTGVSFEGWQVDSLDDPTEGFAVSFRPDAVIRRTVFAFNIAVFRGPDQRATLIPPLLDRANGNPEVGNGPGVALADKSVVSQYSVFPQIMLWGATPVCPNGIGYCAKNGAFLNGINAVALWMHKHYLALSGGEILLTNCASQFGDYSLWAEGSTQEVDPADTNATLVADTAAADAVEANADGIIDQMWTDLVGEGYSVDETATRRDAALFLLAMEYDLRVGQQESAQRFVKGLFDYAGDFVAPGAKAAFQFSFENMRDQIKALGDVGSSAGAMVDGLVDDVVVATMDTPQMRTKASKITSVGHQWNNTMSGVNGRALDRPTLPVIDSIVELDLGTVTWSGIDDLGNQYFSGGARVNPNTGKFEGPPVGRTIDPRARLAALIAGGQQ